MLNNRSTKRHRIINAIRVAERRECTRGSAGIRSSRGLSARHAERAWSHLHAVGRPAAFYSITRSLAFVRRIRKGFRREMQKPWRELSFNARITDN